VKIGRSLQFLSGIPAALILIPAVHAQTSTGRILGGVRDQSHSARFEVQVLNFAIATKKTKGRTDSLGAPFLLIL
jgi:hypothetical protein